MWGIFHTIMPRFDTHLTFLTCRILTQLSPQHIVFNAYTENFVSPKSITEKYADATKYKLTYLRKA